MATLPTYVILDFETTGLDEASSEIIEIGAILVEGFEEKARFQRFVKPKNPIPLIISQLTGITQEMVDSAPSLAEVTDSFLQFLGKWPLVAHNASIEKRFLDYHLPLREADGESTGYVVQNSIEPLALLLADHSSHSMESMRKWAGMSLEGSHRADKDCEDLLAVLKRAHEWMAKYRPEVGTLARKYLGPDSAGDGAWWWNWYFEGIGGDETPELPAVEGDLRELRKQDAEREIDWGRSVDAERVHAILKDGPEGSTFRYRESQEKMAQEVRAALVEGSRLAIEAPTGTGKSVAYLVPGVLAAHATGAPLVVSTHSKSLQDQLLEKDIPLVRDLLGLPEIRATTVKGQENYICLRKLHGALSELDGDSTVEERFSAAYLAILTTLSPVAELDRVSHYLRMNFQPLGGMIERIKSHHLTTKGPGCPFYDRCQFYNSARLAHQSDVVIANHALVFHWPSQLPKIRNVVFDEAHHLEDQITDAFSAELSELRISEELERFSRKHGKNRVGDSVLIARLLSDLTLAHPHGSDEPSAYLTSLAENVRSRLVQLQSIVPAALPAQRESNEYEACICVAPLPGGPTPRVPRGHEALMDGFRNLSGALRDMSEYLLAGVAACEGRRSMGDQAQDLLNAHAARFTEFHHTVLALLGEWVPGGEGLEATGAAGDNTQGPGGGAENLLRLVYWNARENVWRIHVAPIAVQTMGKSFFLDKRSIVLTSATLSAGNEAGFITHRIGLELAKPLIQLPSPFALDTQAVVYIPEDIDQPGTQGHLEALIHFTEQTATVLGGRTLLLMTSNKRLRYAADILRERLQKHGITVLDALSDRRAVDVFRNTERALLIGSERYGEGLDVPGALSCVIIEKINEAMTRGPLAEARKARTRFALFEYDFPLRMIWLKQRAGRLVRCHTDRGAIVIFDSRFYRWSRASQQQVLQTLAPIPVRTGSRDTILERLEE